MKLTLNGKKIYLDVSPDTPLLWAVRDNLGLIVDEPGLPLLAPAVVNAIYQATGKWLRKLPIDSPELQWS